MRTIAQATGALFAVAMAVAPAWAELTLTAVGLPDDSGWTSTAWTAGNKTLTEDTAFTSVTGGASTITATGHNISLEGAERGTQITWDGTIAADTIYLKQGRFSPANSASLGFLGSAKVYVKGQFFADAWQKAPTGINLSNEFYLAPSTYTEGNFNNVSIRVNEGNLTLTGKVTLLPESTSIKGTVKVKTSNAASANRTLTLSQLDLTQVAVGGNTTECLTVDGYLTVVFADGATLNLPTTVVDQGWVKVLTAGKVNIASFNSLTVKLGGAAVDSQRYTVVKNAATGSVKVMTARESRDFDRTLSTANEQWTAGAEETLWGSAGVNPSEIDSVALTVATPSTLTLSKETMVTSLTLNGPSALTFAPTTSGETTTGSLTVLSSTAVNTNTDVSAITASLGTVTLASGKTLTAKSALDFSSITAGSGATVKYTAPRGSIAKVDNATVELAAGASTINGITLPSAGGTYKVSSGTYTGMTLAITNTQTNYDFAGGKLTFNGEFSFGRATATISGGKIYAEKMVTVQGNNEGRTSSVTQTGGDIILSGTGDGTSTQNATVMFGHWPNATSTYTLSGGSIKATNGGGMRFGNDSPSTLALSGTGLLKVGGIWGDGDTNCALNQSGGILSLGSEGFKAINRLAVTMTGGELNAYATNTIAQPITLNGPTTFSADADCEMTVQGALSGSGALTIGTATATGAVNLGTQRPKIAAIADGATLKLTATDLESAGRAIILPTTATSAIAKERFSVVNSTGVAMTVTGTSLADGQLTLTLEASEATLILGDLSDVWSGATAWPNTGNVTINAAQLTEDKTVTIPAPAEGTRALTQVTVVGNTTAKVTLVVSSGVSIVTLVPYGYVRVDVDTVNALTTAPVVPAGATLEVIAGSTSTDTATLSKAISGAGKFAKGGAGVLTLGADITITTGGGSIVQSGTLKFAASGDGTITTSTQPNNYTSNAMGDVRVCENAVLDLNGRANLWLRTITLETGATYKNGSTSEVSKGSRQLRDIVLEGDAFVEATSNFGLLAHNYNATTLTLNGHTLTKKGSGSFWLTKCTISGGTLKVKEGAFIGNSSVTPCTISGAVTFERASDATGTARFDFTQATATDSKFLTIASGATLTTAGPVVADGIKLGYTVLTGNLVANNNVSIAHLQIGANKTLTGTGTITVKDATLAESVTLTTLANMVLDLSAYTKASPKPIAAKVVVGADSGARDSVTLTTKGYLTLSNDNNKIAETGKLVVASGTTTLSAAGSGGGIKGNLSIASGATLKCGSGDAPLYNGSQTFDISGTLELTGETRWTISSGATIALHAGALLKGTGPASGNNYAFDFWKGGAITADGDATIEATLGDHIGGQTLTITQSAGTTTITGEVRSGLTLTAAGSGTVAYAPAAGVTATSSPLVVDTGATLQLLPAAAFTLNGTVTGAGTLVIGDGSAATAVTLATAGNGTDVTVSPKATLTVATGAGEADSNKSFADGKTVTNNGTLKLTSGYGYFKIAGTGKTVVPGSDFLFGIGGANGDGPFSNGLEVPASANFRIRPWNAPQTIVAKGTAAVNGSITKNGGNDTVTLQIAAGTTLAGSSTFSIPVTFANDTTAKMDSNATFTFSSALTVPKNVMLPGTVTLAEGATLSGVGDLSGTVTLGNGVIIDATESTVSGHLQLTGAVTLGDTLKVKASKLTNVLDVPTSARLDLVKVSLTGDSIVPAGTKLVTSSISSVTTLKLFVPPAMPKDDAKLPPAIAGNNEIMAAIQAKAEAWLDQAPISEITSVSAKNSAGGAASADGATLFTGLEVAVEVIPGTAKEDGTYLATATVTYDFGVSDITVKSANLTDDPNADAQLYVVVCAKVSNATGESANTADYATDIALKLLNEDAEVDAEVSGVVEPTADELAALGLTAAAGERWLAVPMETLFPVNQETGAATTGTMKLKVQASK